MTADQTPYIMIDVDGVLNPDVSNNQRRKRFRHEPWETMKLHTRAGSPIQVSINREHGRWLELLAKETGAELAWGTMWEEGANEVISPMFGWGDLPYATFDGRPPENNEAGWLKYELKGQKIKALRRGGGTLKAWGIREFTQGRPYVWLDDFQTAPQAAAELGPRDQKRLIITTNPAQGLQPKHLIRARHWLDDLNCSTRAVA